MHSTFTGLVFGDERDIEPANLICEWGLKVYQWAVCFLLQCSFCSAALHSKKFTVMHNLYFCALHRTEGAEIFMTQMS